MRTNLILYRRRYVRPTRPAHSHRRFISSMASTWRQRSRMQNWTSLSDRRRPMRH